MLKIVLPAVLKRLCGRAAAHNVWANGGPIPA